MRTNKGPMGTDVGVDRRTHVPDAATIRRAVATIKRVLRDSAAVCKTCKDKHYVYTEGNNVRRMCLACPLPCMVCKGVGQKAYCAKTPCGCGCHVLAKGFRHT